ncbi:MAG: acyl-CoA thioesterase [Treponema sp.]|jgi:acyl-CoA thioester hydrolase|nr:acyl-CoA thioesterase [Treponema sp.]
MISAEIEFNVEFYDLDPMQVVWHGNYIKYFEKARCALLDRIHYGYTQMVESGYAFPVTKIDVKYVGPFKMGARIRAKATLTEYENGLKIAYELYNAESGALCTKGSSSQMAFNLASLESCFASPKALIDKVEAFMAEEHG